MTPLSRVTFGDQWVRCDLCRRVRFWPSRVRRLVWAWRHRCDEGGHRG